MDPLALTPESVADELAESRATLRRFEERIIELAKDSASLKALVSEKNTQIVRLEAENVRLKMTRTDAELGKQVDGLRIEVGKKDRELVDLRRAVEKYQGNEKILLGRALLAEQKTLAFQNTLITAQVARDAAQAREQEAKDSADERVEEQNQLRLEAVRGMVSAVDRSGKLDQKVLDLLKVVQAAAKVVPLLPPGLVKSSKDVQVFVSSLKKLDPKAT
jgi:hypothetical protein